MEDIIKFVFYAIIFVIYVVSQIRKAKNKGAEAGRVEPDPIPVNPQRYDKAPEKQSVKPTQEAGSGYRAERVNKPLLKVKTAEIPKAKVEYKSLDMFDTLESEDSKFKKVLEERRIEEQAMRKNDTKAPFETPLKAKVLLSEEQNANNEFFLWFKKKSSLKQAFIASEVFNRKY